MDSSEVLDIARTGVFVLLKTGLPLILVALSVGLIISLFQALTQIQEMTLSFVPKIIAIFLAMLIFMPYMLDTMKDFAEELSIKITEID